MGASLLQPSVSTMNFQIRNLSISKFGHDRVTRYSSSSLSTFCAGAFLELVLICLVIKHSKFVWPLSLKVSANVDCVVIFKARKYTAVERGH